MTTWTARPATEEAFVLAEGPVWDAARGLLLWVDIPRGLVLEGILEEGRIRVGDRHEFEGFVGAVTPSTDGGLLVAATETLVRVGADGGRLPGYRIIPASAGRRLNDAATDPAGRYLVGTRAFDDSSSEELLRLRPDGTVEYLDDDLTMSNGLAWSPDGRTLYSVDTMVGQVWARDYDPATGAVGQRRLFAAITEGYPDGLCTDADGHVWIAIWGAGEVRRFAPDGTLVGRVEVAAPHTTSVAFAGPDLDILVITTATDELDAEQAAAFPDSGRLFVAEVDAVGLPLPPWDPHA